MCVRPTAQYIHRNPVIVTNSPLQNQYQLGTSVGYPSSHLSQNQFYASSSSPPLWNKKQINHAKNVIPPTYNHYPMGRTHTIHAGKASRDARFKYGNSPRTQSLKQ